MTTRRAGTTAVLGALAIALLVLVLATWASSIGPSEVLRGDGPSPVGTPTDEPAPTDEASVPQDDATEESSETPRWIQVAAFVVNLAVVALLAVLLVRYVILPMLRRVRGRRERRRRGREAPTDPDFTVLEPPQRVARALLDDAAAQRRLLEDGSPRNAVVECWHRFEVAAAAAGLERRDWETSSEYTMRVLDLVDAHQPAVSRLGDLYREARFSEHDLTEADRADALEALDTIHRTIGVSA